MSLVHVLKAQWFDAALVIGPLHDQIDFQWRIQRISRTVEAYQRDATDSGLKQRLHTTISGD